MSVNISWNERILRTIQITIILVLTIFLWYDSMKSKITKNGWIGVYTRTEAVDLIEIFTPDAIT